MKGILAFLSGIGLGLAVLYGCNKASEGAKEVSFKVKFKAYDTKIDSATIEGFTIRNVLVVRVGNKVNVELINESPISENFSIEGYGVNTTLKPQETAKVSFTADRPGAYTIWCNLHPKNIHLPGSFVVVE
ncbi:MAG: cupredoxin domain-containing protein [candidate division WOR-3 bacterium]